MYGEKQQDNIVQYTVAAGTTTMAILYSIAATTTKTAILYGITTYIATRIE